MTLYPRLDRDGHPHFEKEADTQEMEGMPGSASHRKSGVHRGEPNVTIMYITASSLTG